MMKEIESALRALPGVRNAVVVEDASRRGMQNAVVHLALTSGSAVCLEEIQTFLERRFPGHARPRHIIINPELPVTPTRDGEVAEGPPKVPLSPRTLIEDIVSGICEGVLGHELPGLHDPLFDPADPASPGAEILARLHDAFEAALPLDGGGACTVTDLARLVETATRRSAGPAGLPESRAPQEDGGLLSAIQQRAWFLNQLEPANFSAHLPVATRLRGPLEAPALEQSFAELARIHPELRSRFPKLDGQPSRTVSATAGETLPVMDLSHLPDSEREQEALRLAREETRREFQLSRDTAWRVLLLRLTSTDHLLVVTLHQIIADRTTAELLLAELQSLYRGFAGAPALKPFPAPLGYRDYIARERRWFQDAESARQLAYWKQQLEDAPATLELPFDRPRPATANPEGAVQSCLLPEPLLRRLRSLGREEGASLFLTLTASLHVLLHRYTGARHILVGTPANLRRGPDCERAIGPWTNTLVLRSRLGDDPTFREHLRRTRATACAACRHQDFPFARLLDELHPDRNRRGAPVFQVLIEQHDEASPAFDLPGLTCSPVTEGLSAVDLDLKITVIAGASPSRIVVEYNPELFDESTVQRLLGCWRTLLESAVTNPDRRVSDLDLLSGLDQRELREAGNGSSRESSPAPSWVQLFEQAVEKHPDALAVTCEGAHLTYRELNARANQLARHLRSRGVGSDALVALSVERSLEMAVGLIGILKAGGAYVPLDPDYPPERLAFILQDAAPVVVLARTQRDAVIPPESSRVVYLDRDRETIEALDSANLPAGPGPEHLAYVIYTSGSSGQPKGVLITHRGLLNLAGAVVDRYGLRADDVILQFSTLNFDIAVEEIFPTWLCGATLVLRGNGSPPAFPQFMRFLAKRRVTVLNLPTAFWHEWVQYLAEAEPEIPPSLRLVIVGGEQVAAAAYARWRAMVDPRVRWLNSYGPTETTVTATVYEPAPEESRHPVPTPVPIGRPIDNVELLVLDTRLKLVPVGVEGELHIGGAGVARGYLNRPDLTAEKFIPHPFGGEFKGLFYRTGDRVRFLPDGNLQFLGRLDQQVKIRGFRIEPGEIETTLGQHPEVVQAVVKVWERASDDRHLVGYIVLKAGSALGPKDLRQYLQSRLPAPLIPSHLMVLPSLPLSPNGKVDHRALPVPDQAPESDEGSASARDRLEFTLIQIWRDVLKLPRIGIQDNFFDLGGHSLMAVRMFTQIEKVVGRPVPLSILFQAPTIEKLAAVLRTDGWQPSKSSLVAIQARGSKTPFFCVHGGGGGVLWYSDIARHLDPDQPFYGLQSPGFDAEREPLTHIEDMAAHYVTEIRLIQAEGPYLLGGASMGGAVAFEMALQLTAQGQQVALLALIDTPRPVAISRFRHRMNGVWESIHHEVFERIAFHRDELGKLNLAGKLTYLRNQASRIGDEPEATQDGPAGSLAGLRHLGPARERVHEANALALSIYSPRPYPGRITLFVARDGEPETFTDPHLGWDGWVGEVERYEVPGDHFSIMREPNVRELAGQLNRCLDRTQRTPSAFSSLLMLLTESPQSITSLVQSVLLL